MYVIRVCVSDARLIVFWLHLDVYTLAQGTLKDAFLIKTGHYF